MRAQSIADFEYLRPCYACRDSDGSEAESCRDRFHEVCELELSNSEYGRMHYYSVDSYVLQHPKTSANPFNAFHLLRLYWLLHIAGPDQVRKAGHRAGFAPRNFRELPYLEPPSDGGPMTVEDIGEAATAEEHGQRVHAWAKSVWTAWSAHHGWVVAYFEALSDRQLSKV